MISKRKDRIAIKDERDVYGPRFDGKEDQRHRLAAKRILIGILERRSLGNRDERLEKSSLVCLFPQRESE